ncbi:MAG: Spy/CpxP family protein refolding chaperone [Firmicutes bacterium]|nr:Spy/CpxP family protein refolding chaperone [Bacillota bacterium]
MKKKLLATLVVAVLVGSISLTTFAMGGGQVNGFCEAGLPKICRRLNLTPEQELKILRIRQDFQKETQPLRFEMQRKQLELRHLWAAKILDQSKIETKEKEVSGLRVQIINKARGMREKVENTLTAEQRSKLEKAGEKCKTSSGPYRRYPRCKEKKDGCFDN